MWIDTSSVFIDKFTPNDEMLMKAKINFTGTVVGSHPNVLKFLGAVVGDDRSKLLKLFGNHREISVNSVCVFVFVFF
jgi:hypothetical protein